MAVRLERRPDGALLLWNEAPSPEPDRTVTARLERWARERPEQTFLAERSGSGWRRRSYAEVWARARLAAARLAPLGLSTDRPLMIIAGNCLAHAELTLGAMLIGAPAALISPAYAAKGADPARLTEIVATLTPGLVVGEPLWLEAARLSGADTGRLATFDMAEAMPAAPLAEVEALAAKVGQDTIAKFLFTSGSTGSPKAVINTQRMLTSNLAALEAVWPQLVERPPVLVDWLPWHHTFGGNVCFGTALHFGGALFIDDGRPRPQEIARTVENLRLIQPSVLFNVPAGYEALLSFLERDRGFAERVFGGLEFLFNAGAALAPATRERLEAAATASIGRCPPIVGSWGATETAPAATMTGFDSPPAGWLGPPIPGVAIKLAPDRGRLEMRVKGPNVTPGYWRAPDATAACFDEEGFYRSGDAGRLADETRPELGLVFDGRLAENFKLSTGAWVHAAAIREAAIEAGGPQVRDAVVAGHDRDRIVVLAWLADGAVPDAARAALAAGIDRYNARQIGSSTRIAAFDLLNPAPEPGSGEITAKGTLNAALVLERRREQVERLLNI
jgi:feruloyl-CoA synthase